MNPCRLTEVRPWCLSRGFHPNRVMGQNFLVDANVAEAIVVAAGVSPGDRVLEVGPGLGALSREILARCAGLCAIEKDPVLHAFLAEEWRGREEVCLIRGDALEVDLGGLFSGGVDHMISSLPYSCGTRILLRMLEHPQAPPSFLVMVQDEVARRLCAGEGMPDRGLSGVLAQLMYSATILRRVSAGCFWPRPEVSSAVVRLRRRHGPVPEEGVACLFRTLTRCAFTYRRKKLTGAFRFLPREFQPGVATGELCRSAGVDPDSRAEALSREQWLALAAAWHAALGNGYRHLAENVDSGKSKGDR